MLPPMKSMKAGAKGKAMTKGALTKVLAAEHSLKQKACSDVIASLVALATSEVKKAGVFTIPGVCRIKTRLKPATKAGSPLVPRASLGSVVVSSPASKGSPLAARRGSHGSPASARKNPFADGAASP